LKIRHTEERTGSDVSRKAKKIALVEEQEKICPTEKPSRQCKSGGG